MALASAIHGRQKSTTNNSTGPTIDLGSAGSYLGVIQNNGTYVVPTTVPGPLINADANLQCGILERHSLCRATHWITSLHAT